MKHILSSAIARYIVADAKRKGKRPPPFEGTRALVERQGWRKIICLTAKCFLLLPLQRLFITHPSTAIVAREARETTHAGGGRVKKETSGERSAEMFCVSALVDNAELAERLYGILRRELQSDKRENRDCTYMVEMDRCAKEKNKEVN